MSAPRVPIRSAVLEYMGEALVEVIRALVIEELEVRLPTQADPKPWLTPIEAGERLGCTPEAIRRRANRGRLETRYQGRRMYVSAESVDRLR